MSQLIDMQSGDGAVYPGGWDTSVGPQNDGTYSAPTAAQPANQPWDTSGNGTGDYSKTVLDVLKLGVGAWSQNRSQQNLLDYRRYEATAGGVFQQGAPVQFGVPGAVGLQMNGTLLLLLAAGAIFLLARH